MAVRNWTLLLMGFLLMSASGGLAVVAWHDGAIGVVASPAQLPAEGDDVRFKGTYAEPERARSLASLVRWNAAPDSALAPALAGAPHDLIVAEGAQGPLLVFLAERDGPASEAVVATGRLAISETVNLAGGRSLHAVLLADVTLAEPLVF